MIKKQITLSIYLLIIIPLWSVAQVQIPVPDVPGSWVNDYAKIFSASETAQLDQKLNEFEYRKWVQVHR